MANQTQIPVIQHPDKAIVQLQQNTNKVCRNINNQVEKMSIIGEIKLFPSSLTTQDFQNQAGQNWILCNGQNCVGTKYGSLFSQTTVPTVSLSGTHAFIRVD